jgi:hypothetical protein
MNDKNMTVWLAVCLLFVGTMARAGDHCTPENAPTAADFWSAIHSPEVAACIRDRTNEEMKRLEIDDPSVGGDLRKARSIRAWYSLLMQLDALKSDPANGPVMLIDAIYNRADEARQSVSSTVYGEAALPHAYQSAWTVDFDGQLPVLLNESESSVLAPRIELESGLTQSCSDEGSTCPKASESAVRLLQNIALAREIGSFYGQPVVVGLAAKVKEINADWDHFLFDSKPMYPQDLWLTDLFTRKTSAYDEQLGFREAPDTQYFLLHPAPGFSYVSDASDGDQLQPAVYVELLGLNKWRWKYMTGVSLIVEYSDRADVEDMGWGALLTFRNKLSLAITTHDGDVGVTLGLDLANFYKDRLKPQIERIKTQLPE